MWLNSCWGVALYPTLVFTSEKASSAESVDKACATGQKLLSCSLALCRYCMKQSPLAKHAANNLAETSMTEVGKGSVLKVRFPMTCSRIHCDVLAALLLRDMLYSWWQH